MSVLIFFIVLFVLILVHEWGHFIVAKKTGMRVDEFGIGFPPRLFGVKKGETNYTFNALPIGGFVRIYGEDSTLGEEAEDYKRSFSAQSKVSQAMVLLAGVSMNVLLAWFLFSFVFALGVPTFVSEQEATTDSRLIVSDVLEDTPAANADIPRGAVILSVQAGSDYDRILYPSSFSAFVEDHEGIPIDITYRFDGEEHKTVVTPNTHVLEGNAKQPAVGVALALVETVRSPIHKAIYDGLTTTLSGLRDITVGLARLLFDTIRGQADFSQIAGPVGIVGLVGQAAEFGFASLLMFSAFISLNLAVINLLPFPALDGGRLLFVLIEAVIRRPINPVWASRLNLAGFALLMVLMVLVTYNDILRIL